MKLGATRKIVFLLLPALLLPALSSCSFIDDALDAGIDYSAYVPANISNFSMSGDFCLKQGDSISGSFVYDMVNKEQFSEIIISGQPATFSTEKSAGTTEIVSFALPISDTILGPISFSLDSVTLTAGSRTHDVALSSLKLASSEHYIIKNDDYDEVITMGFATSTYTSFSSALTYYKKMKPGHTALIVGPNSYEETLPLFDVNGIDIYGYGIGKTIVSNPYGDYNHATIEKNGPGFFYGLSFLNSATVSSGSLGGYSLHYDYQGDGGICLFQNCYFSSQNNSAVGVGLRANHQVQLVNCQIECTSTYGYSVFVHNAQANGEENQKFTMVNCTAHSIHTGMLEMHDSNLMDGGGKGNVGGEMTVLFQKCNFTTDRKDLSVLLRGPTAFGTGYLIGSIALDPASAGNNIPVLNA
jgi:hypothetical protein